MSELKDFVIENGVLKAYNGNDSCVVIPDGVTTITSEALKDKPQINTIVIPQTVTMIEDYAFCHSWSFSNHPECLSIHLSDLNNFLYATREVTLLTSTVISKIRFVINGQILENLTIPAEITRVGSLFKKCEDLKKLVISEGVTEIDEEAFCYCRNLSEVYLPKSLIRVGKDAFSSCPIERFEIAEGASFKMGRIFNYHFPTPLIEQIDKFSRMMDAEAVKAYVVPYHWERLSEVSKARIFLNFQDAQMKKHYKKLIKPLDYNLLSQGMLQYFGPKLSKKECGILADFMTNYLAYLSGECLKSMYDTVSAQKAGADAIKQLDASTGLKKKIASAAKMPSVNVDHRSRTEFDIAFDNMGFDDNGTKVYDLGNKEVLAAIQPDFTVLIIDSTTGKTVKSVPKRGADTTLYNAANEDFKAVSKAVKSLYTVCKDKLYAIYLSAEEFAVETWKKDWIGNYITRTLASMVVWQQGDSFFIVDGVQPVTVDGKPYTLTGLPIRIGSAADMSNDTITAWQKRFNALRRQQPFLQIWEPVRRREDIQENRYDGYVIRTGYMRNQKTLGIDIAFYSEEWGDEPSYCSLQLEGFDIETIQGEDINSLKISKITPLTWNRRCNAIISFLDRISFYDKLYKDDITLPEILDQFTLEQIMDFLSIAVKHSLPNATALLLEYKAKHFVDFDPMEEFVLE